ncbi:MAG: choice-of-anchor Q domain-containing protein [Candidatus Latescibacterota bacterium]
MPNPARDRTGAGIVDDAGERGYALHDALISGNVVHDIGAFGVTPQSGRVHGIYLSFPRGEVCTNKVNNCVFGNARGGIATASGSHIEGTVRADPGFVEYRDDGTGDYHLAAGSPCIDAGTAAGAPAKDLDGNPRPQGAACDIGPYEFGGMAAPAPPTPPP